MQSELSATFLHARFDRLGSRSWPSCPAELPHNNQPAYSGFVTVISVLCWGKVGVACDLPASWSDL